MRRLIDRQRTLVQGLGRRVAALGVIKECQIVEAAGDARVIGAESLLTDRQRALVQGLGLGIAALDAIKLCQAV